MNRQNIIRGAAVIAVLMILFPPHIDHFDVSPVERWRPAGYYFIGSPPVDCQVERDLRYCTLEVDTTRLFLQLLALGMIAGGFLFTIKPKGHTRVKRSDNADE